MFALAGIEEHPTAAVLSSKCIDLASEKLSKRSIIFVKFPETRPIETEAAPFVTGVRPLQITVTPLPVVFRFFERLLLCEHSPICAIAVS